MGDWFIKTDALTRTQQMWSRGVWFHGINSWALWCSEFPNTIWILHFWGKSSTSNALSLKAREPGRDRLTDACGLQSEGNFSGVFPEAEFQLKDLLWRKLPYFLSYLEVKHRRSWFSNEVILQWERKTEKHLPYTNSDQYKDNRIRIRNFRDPAEVKVRVRIWGAAQPPPSQFWHVYWLEQKAARFTWQPHGNP